jgi:hypothetical protein
MTLAIWVVVSLVILRGVPNEPRVWGPEELAPVESGE